MSALKISFGMHFGKSPQHEAPPVGTLVSSIDADRKHGNLSSAIRLFVLDHYRAQADARRSAEGPIENGHPVRSGRP